MTQRSAHLHLGSKLGALLAGAVVVLAACGGSSGSGNTLPADVDLTVVAVDGIAWDAQDYSVTTTDRRATIGTRNDSSLPHNLYIIADDGTQNPTALDIPSKGDVDSASFTLDAGTYTIVCKIPGHSNMKAALTVD